MRFANSSRLGVRSLVTGAIVFNAALLACFPLLPFIDLPNHLAEAVIYRAPEVPENMLRSFYQPVPWYFPNSFHAVFCALFPSVEWGNKLFHILYVVLLHGGMFLVIRQLGGNGWYGLLGMLFTYNYNVTYGFVGFSISIPTLIILFYLILREFERERILHKVFISATLLLMFFMHAQNALLGLVLYGGMMLYRYRTGMWRRVIPLLAVPAPLIALIFVWWFSRPPDNSGDTIDYLRDYYASAWLETFVMRARIAVFDNFQLFEGWTGIAVAFGFFICVLAPVVFLRPWERNRYPAKERTNISLAFVFFLSVWACYMFLPDKLPGQTPLFQRFCTIVMLAFIILCSVWIGNGTPRWLRAFVISVCLIYSALWAEYIWSFNRHNRGFNKEFFSGIDSHDMLAGLIYDNKYRGRKVYIHFPSYFIVWNKGLSATKIIDYRFGIVRRTSTAFDIPFYHELIGENYRFQSQYDAVDLFLVRGDAPVGNDQHLRNFQLIRKADAWKLYERTLRSGD